MSWNLHLSDFTCFLVFCFVFKYASLHWLDLFVFLLTDLYFICSIMYVKSMGCDGLCSAILKFVLWCHMILSIFFKKPLRSSVGNISFFLGVYINIYRGNRKLVNIHFLTLLQNINQLNVIQTYNYFIHYLHS